MQEEARRSCTHKFREGVKLEVSCQVAELDHRSPGDVQITFLRPEAEESLDPSKGETADRGLSWPSHT